MNYYVIGDDKSLEEAYTASEIDEQIQPLNTSVANNTSAIQVLQQSSGNAQKKITSGTSAPSGGSNGDIYIQY